MSSFRLRKRLLAAQVVQCIHGLSAAHLQAQLARMPAALQMGPKERAVYLGRKVLRGVKVAPVLDRTLSGGAEPSRCVCRAA